MARGHLPYRGDGNPNHPQRRFPLTETQKSRMRAYGCIVFLFCIPFVFFMITAQNAFMGFGSIVVILFVVILFFAIQDAQGIATITEDDFPVVDRKDPAMLDDYLAQIEWKQTHRRNHPKEPKWKFHPTLGKVESQNAGCGYPILLIIITTFAFILAYFFGINSPISIFGAVILGLAGIFIYLFRQE